MVTADDITNAVVNKEENEKKESADDGSSSDGEVPELEEGEVTEEQKKVAEAAGIAEQVFIDIDFANVNFEVTDRGAKQSRSEKKARKLFSKLGMI
jgi:nascent polypeptide-associated complex subunit alpha